MDLTVLHLAVPHVSADREPSSSQTAEHGAPDTVVLGRWAMEIVPAVREAIAKELGSRPGGPMSDAIAAEQRADIEALYAAFNRRDIETVLERLAPDVVWANGLEGGYLHGRDAARDYWVGQFQRLRPMVEPRAFRVDPDGRVDVTIQQVVRSLDGALLAEQDVTHSYLFDRREVVRFDIR